MLLPHKCIHSSQIVNEYWYVTSHKPTSVRNKPGYTRTAAHWDYVAAQRLLVNSLDLKFLEDHFLFPWRATYLLPFLFLIRVCWSGEPSHDVLPQQPAADPLYDSRVQKCPVQLEVPGWPEGDLQEHSISATKAFHTAPGRSCDWSCDGHVTVMTIFGDVSTKLFLLFVDVLQTCSGDDWCD